MRGQSSIEIMFIVSAIVIIVGTYAVAFYQESRKTFVLSSAKIVSDGLAALSVEPPCLYSSVNHIYFESDRNITVEYSSLANGGLCVRPLAPEDILDKYFKNYSIIEK